MRHEYYDVDGNPCDADTWTRQFRDPATKFVANTKVGGSTVSTVYLGLDHGYGDEPPKIFETMIFEDGPLNNECWRYSSKAEALAGHEAALKRLEFARRCRFADLEAAR